MGGGRRFGSRIRGRRRDIRNCVCVCVCVCVSVLLNDIRT